MAVALALVALLIEALFGYPDPLARAIGHPVTWIGRLIGEMLVEEKLASKDEVEVALERQRQLRGQRIGDYLAENEIVSREQLALAIRHQESRPILRLGEALQPWKLAAAGLVLAGLALNLSWPLLKARLSR